MFDKKCDLCIANKYGLWGMKKAPKNLPKVAKKVLQRLLKGEGLYARLERPNVG